MSVDVSDDVSETCRENRYQHPIFTSVAACSDSAGLAPRAWLNRSAAMSFAAHLAPAIWPLRFAVLSKLLPKLGFWKQSLILATCANSKSTELLTVLNHYFHTALADSERWRTESGGLTPAGVEAELIALEYMARDTRERLSLHSYKVPYDNLKMVASDAGFEVPAPDSDVAKELARGILRTDARLIEIEMRRTRGDYTDDTSLMQALAAPPAFAGSGSRRLSEVIRLFSEENKDEWNHRTVIDNKAIFRDLIEILGDPPIGLIEQGCTDRVQREDQAIAAKPQQDTTLQRPEHR